MEVTCHGLETGKRHRLEAERTHSPQLLTVACRFWGKPLPSKLPWDLSTGKNLIGPCTTLASHIPGTWPWSSVPFAL